MSWSQSGNAGQPDQFQNAAQVYAGMTPEQQQAYYQQQQQQWVLYQQQYNQWFAKYGEQYTKEMQKIQTGPPLPPSDPQPPKPPEPEPPFQQDSYGSGHSSNMNYTQTAVISQPALPSQKNQSDRNQFQKNQNQFQKNQNQNDSGGRNSFGGGNQRGRDRDRGGRGNNNNNNNNNRNNSNQNNWNNDNQYNQRGGGGGNQRGGKNNWNNRNEGRNQDYNQGQNRGSWNNDRNPNQGNQSFQNNSNQNNSFSSQQQQHQSDSNQQYQQKQQQPQQPQQQQHSNLNQSQNQNLKFDPQNNTRDNSFSDPNSLANIPIEVLEEKNTEELAFDEQFRKWEEEFENWKKANANHPDKNAYREYEEKFEDCRRKLLERREQMRKRKIEQLKLQYANCPPIQQPQTKTQTQTSSTENTITSTLIGPEIPQNDDWDKSNDNFADDMDFASDDVDGKISFSEDTTAALEGWLSKSSAGIPGLDLVGNEKKGETAAENANDDGVEVIDLEAESVPVVEKPNRNKRPSKWDTQDKSKQMKMNPTNTQTQPDQKINQPGNSNSSYLGIQLAQPSTSVSSQIDNTLSQAGISKDNISDIIHNKDLMALLAASLNTANTANPVSQMSTANVENFNRRNWANFGQNDFNQSGNSSFGNSSSNFGNNMNVVDSSKPKIKSLLDIDPFDTSLFANQSTFNPNMEGDSTSRMSGNESVRSSMNSFQPDQEFSQSYENLSQTNQIQCDYFVPAEVHDHNHGPVPPSLYEDDRYFKPAKIIDYNHKTSGMFPDEEPQEEVIESDNERPIPGQRPWHQGSNYKHMMMQKKKRFDYLQFAQPEETVSNPYYPGKWQSIVEIDRPPPRNKRFKKKTAKILSIIKAKRYQDEELLKEQMTKRLQEQMEENLKDLEEISDSEMDDGIETEKDNSDQPIIPGFEVIDISKPKNLFNIDIPKEDFKKELNLERTINCRKYAINVETILMSPGRYNRPKKIVIILRGPSGSGKSYLAKLIKDKEIEEGGSAPRLLSIDDYFLVETEETKKCEKTGRMITDRKMIYEYEDVMLETYMQSLIKSYRKTIQDGLFDFIIIDCNNENLKYYNEFHDYAKLHGFMPYTCEMEMDPEKCFKQNIHGRSLEEIKKSITEFETTPDANLILNPKVLFDLADAEKRQKDEEEEELKLLEKQKLDEANKKIEQEERSDEKMDSEANEDFEMHIDDFEVVDEILSSEEDSKSSEEVHGRFGLKSKWDVDQSDVNGLARLDGTSKPLKHQTMEDYLQLEDYLGEPEPPRKPGKKRVRWADLEEKRAQQKMRAIGFVVGQTDWKRMMDPTEGSSALTQTKYIERVRRY